MSGSSGLFPGPGSRLGPRYGTSAERRVSLPLVALPARQDVLFGKVWKPCVVWSQSSWSSASSARPAAATTPPAFAIARSARTMAFTSTRKRPQGPRARRRRRKRSKPCPSPTCKSRWKASKASPQGDEAVSGATSTIDARRGFHHPVSFVPERRSRVGRRRRWAYPVWRLAWRRSRRRRGLTYGMGGASSVRRRAAFWAAISRKRSWLRTRGWPDCTAMRR